MSLLRAKIIAKAIEITDRLAEQRNHGMKDNWASRSFTQIEDGVTYDVDLKITCRDDLMSDEQVRDMVD